MSAPEMPPKSWDDVQGVTHLTSTANALAKAIRERDALAERVKTWRAARIAAMEDVNPETWRDLADAEAGLVAALSTQEG